MDTMRLTLNIILITLLLALMDVKQLIMKIEK